MVRRTAGRSHLDEPDRRKPRTAPRTVGAPHWMAAYPYWTDDGKSGGIPAVKIKVYQCIGKVPSTPPADPSPSPSGEPTS